MVHSSQSSDATTGECMWNQIFEGEWRFTDKTGRTVELSTQRVSLRADGTGRSCEMFSAYVSGTVTGRGGFSQEDALARMVDLCKSEVRSFKGSEHEAWSLEILSVARRAKRAWLKK